MARKLENIPLVNGAIDLNARKKQVELLIQSPYLYIQSTGSDGTDGSAKGFHLRWDYLRNLGNTHLPKGNLASTNLNFNRDEDYVHIFRSRYTKRNPTIIDFANHAPDIINDALRLWIYSTTNTQTTVYIYFRSHDLYDEARQLVNPATDTIKFLQRYGNGLIEAEVKGKLFFAAEFYVTRSGNNPVLRTEAISVVENLPLSPKFVSCRQKFNNDNWCSSKGTPSRSAQDHGTERAATTTYAPPCCKNSTNLFENGNFEEGNYNFETNYNKDGTGSSGNIWIAEDASKVNEAWSGFAHSGKKFLLVDGAEDKGKFILRKKIAVRPGTTYCFSAALLSLSKISPATLHITLKSADRIEKHHIKAPASVNEWDIFSLSWFSAKNEVLEISIYNDNEEKTGNDFGLDSLWFCEQAPCKQRLVAENIRSVRFDINGGHIKVLELETYDDYMAGARNWVALNEKFSLNKDTAKVLDEWLESPEYPIHDLWPKFNDDAKVNIPNYRDRWKRPDGIRAAVSKYVSLSDTDPMANAILPGADPEDGSINVSYLDLLKIVALDFHIARMLGQGTIDIGEPDYDGPYIYAAEYLTEGLLDIHSQPTRSGHIYMSVPTTRRDYRLPDVPRLKPIRYGLFVNNGSDEPSVLTDANGYTAEGTSRFISLFMEQEDSDAMLGNFFVPAEIFCSTEKTSPVFFGLEYRKTGDPEWNKPELAHDNYYYDTGTPKFSETNGIPNSGDEDKVLFVHQERESGSHQYSSYGINWFSRPSKLGNSVQTDITKFPKANTLLRPYNFQVQLVQQESPLLLTTETEQVNLAALTGADKTYIRVTFDYFHTHDINYKFGDRVELFWREEPPRNVMGAVKSVTDDPSDDKLCIIETKSYVNNSNHQTITPALAVGLYSKFIGGICTVESKNFIIKDVRSSLVPGDGPIFQLSKIVELSAIAPGGGSEFMTVETLTQPATDQRFLAIENLADFNSWGTGAPLSTNVQIGDASWTVVPESYIDDGETISRDLRGVWGNATITDIPDTVSGEIIGVYQIQFDSYQLANHPQAGNANAVNWYNGVVRILKAGSPTGQKKVLEVIKIEELGTGQPLRLIVVDTSYDAADPILMGTGVTVNYYPGYRAYLIADPVRNLDAAHILPAAGEGSKKTWMGARSKDTTEGFASAVGIPAPLIAFEFIEPLPPESPTGGAYATHPDFYYKATYTFSVQFAHQPFAAAFYRTTEDSILRALYRQSTVDSIKEQLKLLGEDDPYRADRWKNLLSFEYIYDDPSKPYFDATATNPNGTFRRFPREAGNFRFPRPDRTGEFTGTQEPAAVLNKVKKAIYEIFTPLTEMPLLFQYIKDVNYQPNPTPQKIRDQHGNLLDPNDPEFKQAPMAKKLSNTKIQFTDFTLDGSSNMFYFYLGREIGNRGKLGDPGPIAGPVYLLNTKPADAPGIKKMYTVPKGPGTEKPSIEFEVNGYPEVQKIRKIEIYRSSEATHALSVRTMKLVKSVDLAEEGLVNLANYKIRDDFANELVPYGDPLYYKMVAVREVKNEELSIIEYAPSLPSKLLLTAIIDTENPLVPQPRFTSAPISGSPAILSDVVLNWDSTVYNGTYYLEKMNRSGNWNTIHIVKSNDPVITVNLSATKLLSGVLPKQDEEGNIIYNRFRVRVENSSGLFGLAEKVLTI